MHRRIIGRAYAALFEQGRTKIATIGCGLSGLDVMIAKAASPDDVPLPDRCVWELVMAVSGSPASSRAFGLAFARRFGRTRCWRVALKCLLLLHRLLRTVPSAHPFRYDVLSARANALLSFRPCRFRDASSFSSSGDYTAFIRSYAHLVDGVLTTTGMMQYSAPGTGSEEAVRALELVHQLQGLVDQAMGCVPSGAAARSPIVRSAMEQVARESFACYQASRGGLAVVLDCILQLPYSSCTEGLAAYRRAADQALRLGEFYRWCRRMKLCGPYEYPLVEEIPCSQVRMLEAFVEKLWVLNERSQSNEHDEAVDKDVDVAKRVVITDEWVKFEKEDDDEEEEEEEKPLIQFSEEDETSWEKLLESSVDRRCANWNLGEAWKSWNGGGGNIRLGEEEHDKSLIVFSPPCMSNPFVCS